MLNFPHRFLMYFNIFFYSKKDRDEKSFGGDFDGPLKLVGQKLEALGPVIGQIGPVVGQIGMFLIFCQAFLYTCILNAS